MLCNLTSRNINNYLILITKSSLTLEPGFTAISLSFKLLAMLFHSLYFTPWTSVGNNKKRRTKEKASESRKVMERRNRLHRVHLRRDLTCHVTVTPIRVYSPTKANWCRTFASGERRYHYEGPHWKSSLVDYNLS